MKIGRKGGVGPWPSGRYFPVSAGGVRPVIRAANSSSDMTSHAAPVPMVWSSIQDGLSTRNVAGNWLRRVVSYT